MRSDQTDAGLSPVPAEPDTPAEALRWAASRLDADWRRYYAKTEPDAGKVAASTLVVSDDLRRWADELDAARSTDPGPAPTTYALPAEPDGPLWGRSGLHWQRFSAGWSNGVRHAIDWSYLLATDGPLSSVPPGTEAGQ